MGTSNLYTILVVDDNRNNLFTVRSLIEEYIDAQVILADTSTKALHELIKHQVDLIILDVHMEKGMDGFELAKIIKSRKKTEHIPIVFLTAACINEEFKRKGFEIGAVDYLTKPIDDFLMINRINVYLKLIEKERKMNIILQEQAEELKRARNVAEAANRAKDVFLANISHELRTPLNILFGTTQIIKFHLDNDEILDIRELKTKLKTQTQNCYRLIRLVNNLIDITKIDSSNFALNLSNCNIVEIVEAIVTSVVEYAQLKNIKIIFDTDVEEVILACDLDSIERIILNLLSNAIKFTPKDGHVFVNISTNDNLVQIKVKDSGIGIPEDEQNMIFERFKQVDNLLTRTNEGSGIGLNLVKSLVEMHGGTIKVNSEYKKGSEFVIEIPITKINNNESHEKGANNIFSNVISKIDVEFSDIYF
ncbi:hybrid sensor histidine kinase/response regulator [Clostridium saccharobutylicum]|uniref:Stage 0 sporulation protein A homolog n=1 Tax=Clostridium saccharobutylicum DSM 13864 TaxID=1345695 RepID=U5MU23_CLOSA|nr:hybrid sensor histidine kinase/response regulator [Clostridium saccharobutylicum]AGX43166.1 sensor histidine kinase ResE [Clostridium saccharobutylicum DSM 13864]AQR90467.1 sensor histidine kinase TodS [Clostridium saccharobutylicum]AQS00373.1 sensor histidine kinase TodS [Clostridium saccharobutylicum]AQS14356.1 sensor histidine kinase TodS [Clostridium saccharobutylicum]MBA2906639.1 signal transduction histidine kinase [Clostridium saccharobutylicum]